MAASVLVPEAILCRRSGHGRRAIRTIHNHLREHLCDIGRHVVRNHHVSTSLLDLRLQLPQLRVHKTSSTEVPSERGKAQIFYTPWSWRADEERKT
jgi:hypothetical protein